MENPHVLKKKHTVIKGALFGAIVFAGLTVLVVAFDHCFGAGSGSDYLPRISLSLLFVMSVPAIIVEQAFGLDGSHLALSSRAFCIFINASLGAILGSLIYSLWVHLMKDESTRQ